MEQTNTQQDNIPVVRLTQLEVQVALDLGMTVEEYAKAKNWLHSEEGKVWIEERDRQAEIQRAKWRKYQRDHRARKKAQKDQTA